MATSVVPTLIGALFTQATAALPTTLVFYGSGVTDDPGDYLMVGISDPDNTEDFVDSADAEGTWAGLGNHARDQKGNIWCVAESTNGNADQKAAVDAAYAIVAAVDTLVRNSPTLGILAGGWAIHGSSERLSMSQDHHGARARVAFQIAFQARL